MNVRKQHQFFVYASHFTTKSMIKAVSYWAYDIFKNPTRNTKYGARKEKYQILLNGKVIRNTVTLLQNWLINMIYELSCYQSFGKKTISKEESLHLIALYNDYMNFIESKSINQDNVLFYVFGAFGEQKKFQDPLSYIKGFSREKYILEKISCRSGNVTKYDIDINKEFRKETGYTIAEYAAIVFALWGLFSHSTPFVKKPINFKGFDNNILSSCNLRKMLSNYSVEIGDIIKSRFKRQIFYTKPIIEFDDEYVCSNPLVLLALFSNCAYWCLRNKYLNEDSQRFTNAFGSYFELYVDEVLSNTLPSGNYKRICEDKREKRADWYIKLGEYEFIVEQKASLSPLAVKQNQPNTDTMDKYFLRNWGEAIKQLESTQRCLIKKNPIKIILMYEDYFNEGLLDHFFELHPEYQNDKKYWLVSIHEFEALMYLYKNSPQLALQIIKEKDMSQLSCRAEQQDLLTLYRKYNVDIDNYLKDYGICDENLNFLIDLYN